MVPTSPSWVIKPSGLGTFHSWWLPGNPVDGHYGWYTSYKRAYTTLPLRHKKVNGKYITGGPWNLFKHTVKHSGDRVKTYRPYGGLAYTGRYMDARPISTWDGVDPGLTLEKAYDDVVAQGAAALAAMRPAPPSFDGLNAIYELREVPGMFLDNVWNLKTKIHLEQLRRIRNTHREWWGRSGGEWYLSIQFGWLPLIKDIVSFCDTFRNQQKIVAQLIRDAGKPVRRSRFLGETSDVSTVVEWHDPGAYGNPYMMPYHVSQCYAPGIGSVVTKTVTTRTWCVGKCRYFLPDGPRTIEWKKKLIRRIYGLRLTPSALYKAMPWSWFLDYFGQLGSFMKAISHGVEDRLIWDYAYVMRHTKVEFVQLMYQHTFAEVGVYPAQPRVQRVTSTMKITFEFKTRAKASIFGFGHNQNGLSPFQLSIMGALGLSKL